jgi:hypothetical protein
LLNNNEPDSYSVGFIIDVHAILLVIDDWQQFKDSRFSLRFKVPERTPQGRFVNKTESEQGDPIRVHFISQNSKELYFEVTKYERLSAQTEYQQHRANLEKRFSEFFITELKEMNWKSHSAYEYSFEWEQGKRSVILVGRNTDVYRFLYDPRSPLNLQILSTVEWVD